MSQSKIVAAIELPLALIDMSATARSLRKQHGKGLIMREVSGRLLVATPGEGDPLGCWCITCDNARHEWLHWTAFRGMVVCPDCGNKRCPKATHHDHACTGSNEPGQEGSVYA